MKENLKAQPIRAFAEKDIPQVADMFQRLLLTEGSSRRNLPVSALPDYFEQIFFHNPWRDDELPSLVYEDRSGRIIGFLGVMPRPMLLWSQPIRVAISFHFMVEPESRSSLAGVQLLRAFFSGPQDLSLTDGAGPVGRKVWEGMGGTTAFLYSQCWTRILRPSRFALDEIGKRLPFPQIARAFSPLCRISDAAVARMLPRFFQKLSSKCSEEELNAESLLNYLPQFSKIRALQPVYDGHSVQWLLKHAEGMDCFGSLKKVLVRDKHEVVGWYLYYLKPGEVGTVLQIAATKNHFSEILDHLFDHARRHDVVALDGRMEPQYIQELADRYCYFRLGSWTLIHSHNSELLNVIQRGDVFLTRLEGEWSLLF